MNLLAGLAMLAVMLGMSLAQRGYMGYQQRKAEQEEIDRVNKTRAIGLFRRMVEGHARPADAPVGPLSIDIPPWPRPPREDMAEQLRNAIQAKIYGRLLAGVHGNTPKSNGMEVE